ncbi:microspherule protein 1 [Drosophila grimshawi]|uniref:GH14562 n=1 Tax=Drosophila grimshawi TaxID=7222 RepID=B4IYX6_DROGR|nr:microspherule protein 1 [Drosophila grimshawi]EDV97684.1 GH14562 [Drosophila grimshawi]
MEGTQLPVTITNNDAPANVKTANAPIVATHTAGVPATVSVSSTSVNTCAAPAATTTTTTTTTTKTLLSKTPIHNLPIELLQNDAAKRRSSSRTIKRKRFDDEIVEYNLTIPASRGGADPNRSNRPRTISQNYPGIVTTQTALLLQSPASTLAAAAVVAPETPQTPGTAVESLPGTPSIVAAAAPATPLTPATPALPLPTVNTSVALAQPKPRPIMDRAPATERRPRPSRTTSNRKPRRNGRPLAQMATKDLGRWKPIDDLALVIGIQQTNDLRMIHRGVKFSCKFTLQELQQRWYALLYEPAVSRIAVSAMRNLHPEMVESVQRKALYSVQEEDLLGTIKSTETPKLEQFQELLDKNAGIFYCARTAKSLHNHWLLLKQYCLLPDQTIKPLQGSDQPLSFSDAEDQILDQELNEPRDEALEIETMLADRRNKRDIRLLENELSRWGVLVDSVLGPTAASEFDNQTLACLCGRLVRYLMRSKEITFGREAKECGVDVDLSLEGPAAKISRRQGTIKMRSNGDFFIANEGKRAIFIDGTPLLNGNKTRLAHNCTVEISGLRFTFLVNYELINAIRQESAKTSNHLN